MDPSEKADIDLKKAQVDQIYTSIGPAGEGAVSAQEIREKLAADKDSPYQGLDLSEPLPEPEPQLPPMPGPGAEGEGGEASMRPGEQPEKPPGAAPLVEKLLAA
jgi:hypothetical protein